jgi:P-type Cu+ transporter
MKEALVQEKIACTHCGDDCQDTSIHIEGEKFFCCDGCKTVYEILDQNGMCTYYNLDENPGITLKGRSYGEKYAYLDNADIARRLLDYADEKLCKITFHVPSIHCSSCIWLLENLYRLKPGISYSRVNFMRKEVVLNFDPQVVQLRQVVELLATLGYEPLISLDDYAGKEKRKENYHIYFKIGVTAFCTGNIMLLSFPEYFHLDAVLDQEYKQFFTWINVVLAMPVFFYGASGYFISAWKSLREKVINLDVPISIGIFTLFARSLYETVTFTGPGYWDSLTGLVFFLLVGKWFQLKTYESLSFERNYKSYFPLAATTLTDGGVHNNVPVSDLAKGDTLLIRNQELIPADSMLLSREAWIDYSFVTGEAEPVRKETGDYIYAGGKQVGESIEVEVQKPVSQSYLTQLWNNEAFSKEKTTPVTRLAAAFSKYFTFITITIAVLAASYWYVVDSSIAMNAFTAVLIVACPCALSLAMPFTMGTTMGIFGRNKFYVKNPQVIQHLADVNHVVFDKTGTITDSRKARIVFEGKALSVEEQQLIKSAAAHSTHPLSRRIYNSLKGIETIAPDFYRETEGVGIVAVVKGRTVKIGSSKLTSEEHIELEQKSALVHVNIDCIYKGYYAVEQEYRTGLQQVLSNFKRKLSVSLLSGDNAAAKEQLEPLFGNSRNMHFEQSPEDKLKYISALQKEQQRVLMIGDGLNDAGALKQSNVGMVLTEDITSFSPACDVIAEASVFSRLYDFIRFSRTSVNIVKASFLLSLVFNFIGLSWAISGKMAPVFAALFMPLTSGLVVIFAVGFTSLYARFRGL